MIHAILKNLIAADEDLTIRQVAILAQAADMPLADCTVRGMAARLAISKPAISRAADKMTDAGLLVRKPDPLDRRSVLLAPTPKGRRLIAQLLALSGAPVARAA